MNLTKHQKAQLQFASDTQYLKSPLRSLWKADQKRRSQGFPNAYGPRTLSFEAFVESFLTDFRLAFVLRKPSIKYDFKEITDAEIDAFWASNRDLFTRYNGDSFDKEECLDIIAKRIREQEYETNVQNLLLQL